MTRNNYTGAIGIRQINIFSQRFPHLKEVQKIQDLKENIASKIMSITSIESNDIQDIESAYINALYRIQKVGIGDKGDYLSKIKLYFENVFKKEDNTGSYLSDFDRNKNLVHKYSRFSYSELRSMLRDNLVSQKEKNDIKLYLSKTNYREIPQTMSRDILFDEELFLDEIGKGVSKKDIECFYEEDAKGVKNYFSLNSLLNYIEVFGSEMGMPNMGEIDDELRQKYFPSIQRQVKFKMYKGLIEELRDKQEVLIYRFTDYEKKDNVETSNLSGFIAEKIVELEFRNMALISDYDIKITKASIGEDQFNKADLFVEIKDNKTGVSIKKELQLTLKKDSKIKQEQIKKRNRILKKSRQLTESELVELTFNDLSSKATFWRNSNRPIGGIDSLLDASEKRFLRETFRRILKDLSNKTIQS